MGMGRGKTASTSKPNHKKKKAIQIQIHHEEVKNNQGKNKNSTHIAPIQDQCTIHQDPIHVPYHRVTIHELAESQREKMRCACKMCRTSAEPKSQLS